jgi:cellulose synthase/poly-beta-1,6-N-acetylglucosamine synthase-like glycosyltransferase
VLVALVPAHDEEGTIIAALRSLQRQSVRPDRVVVVADNCTDRTVVRAKGAGAQVIRSLRNDSKKAGALNQAFQRILPTLDDDDVVLVMDADSALAPRFLEVALRELKDPTVGAVGGVFDGARGAGLLGQLQRMEYGRYARELDRSDRVWVLTGTATVHRVRVLREIAAARGTTLPGVPGDVYERSALTEDMEITLAIKALGHRLVSPAGCRVVTEVMPSLGALWRQRLRWQRGAIENLRTYGWCPVTRPYVRQQALMAMGILAMVLYLAYTAALLAQGRFGFSPFWTSIGAVFVLERVATVWRVGWWARLSGALLVLDWAYDLFLQSVIVRAALDSLLRRPQEWHHAQLAGR